MTGTANLEDSKNTASQEYSYITLRAVGKPYQLRFAHKNPKFTHPSRGAFWFPSAACWLRAQLSGLALEICKFPFYFLDSVFNYQKKKKIYFLKMQNIFMLVTKPKPTPDGNTFKILPCLALSLQWGYYYSQTALGKKKNSVEYEMTGNRWKPKQMKQMKPQWLL